MENSKDNIPPTLEIPLEEVVMYDTPRRTERINVIVNELDNIENRLTLMEEEKLTLVNEVKRNEGSSKVVLPRQRDFIVTFSEEALDALSVSDALPDYLSAYPHLDDILEEQGENGPKKKGMRKSMRTRCAKTLCGALCFWRTMCLILAVTVVILIIFAQKPVRNIYYIYE